MKHLAGMPN